VKTADWLFWQSSSPPSPFAYWAFPGDDNPFPSLPGTEALPHPQCARFKTNTTPYIPSSALLPPTAGRKRPAPGMDPVTWGRVPLHAHFSEAFFRSSYTKWTHVIECTWLSHVLLPTWAAQRARTAYLDSDTNKESCSHKSLLQL